MAIINAATLAAIAQSFQIIFNEAFTGAPSQWNQVAMLITSSDRVEHYPWLGDVPAMREWIGDRVLKDLAAFDYTILNRSWEATIEVDRDDIDDDRIGLYRPKIQALGDAAKRHRDVLIFALLAAGFATACFDGQYFFDSDHPVAGASVSNTGGGAGTAWYLLDLSRPLKPLILQVRKEPEFVSQDDPRSENAFMRKKFRFGVDDRKAAGFGLWQLAYGSKQTLNATYYAAARTAMMSFKNDNGEPLGIMPTHLVVPPSLESAGRTLLVNERNDAGASNPWYKSAELVVVPWLA
ncbi:MAG: Mu-like prophage major head subunit gpT family protein [Thermodesulfobacteriota bacterium]